ncbi:MAG: FAD-dependent oxidoreductase [Gammaproteobacteria bacterium]|nr:FAD-dependent oxidoreductase [Gammaproteobacteria bacterium]MDH5693705.1 FAD-dependent oxidoreductase [Gammaproteobacteria bacterium]
MPKHGVVIIGTGLAGYTTAKEFRKNDPETPLTLITDSDGAFYSKPMLSNAYGTNKLPTQLATQNAEQMADTLKAKVLTHRHVMEIDLNDSVVLTQSGDNILFDRLVLAIGASPIVPPLEGNALERIHQVNSLADYARFRGDLAEPRKVAIIGAGLIGCEFANDLRRGGHEVSVFGPDALPLSNLLPAQAASELKTELGGIGVDWQLGSAVKTVNLNDEQFELILANGQSHQADVMLSAIGLRANLQLAKQAGLSTARGIVTDRFLQTSSPNVYALGDCAEVEGLFLPFVLPIMSAARALGKTLAGEKTSVQYPAMPVVIKTPAYPLVVSSPPAGAEGNWQIEETGTGLRCLLKNGLGQLVGFALTQDCVKERQALVKELPPLLNT